MLERIMTAMKAGTVPAGESGLWTIEKVTLQQANESVRGTTPVVVPAGTYTYLKRLTTATMFANPPGEIVMEDTPFELRTHLQFALQAHGRVLITGLGLGCIARGVLANPAVTDVTVVERSPDVLKLVRPYMPTERLTIIEADAIRWTKRNRIPFDCAWHDLWTDREKGEPHLDKWHAALLLNCRATVRRQGAWSFDRRIKKMLIEKGIQWLG